MNPGLFGIMRSNRNFSEEQSWGKNVFNSAFPSALACFMQHQGIELKYICVNTNLSVVHDYLSTTELFGLNYQDSNLFFAFESDFIPYQAYVVGNLPRIDLVTIDTKTQTCVKGLEIKLTALPDQTTYKLPENMYSSEIVIRPDTIVYMALSLITSIHQSQTYLRKKMMFLDSVSDWTDIDQIIPTMPLLIQCFGELIIDNCLYQKPLIVQPIWKTLGKTQILADNAFDIFVWSDFALGLLIYESTVDEFNSARFKIGRKARALIWVLKMLYDYSMNGRFDPRKITDTLTYDTRNDKAFAASGLATYKYLKSPELCAPRVSKNNVKDIILGGGQNMLSPERRLDSVLIGTPGLFE